jgi:predicted peptidase
MNKRLYLLLFISLLFAACAPAETTSAVPAGDTTTTTKMPTRTPLAEITDDAIRPGQNAYVFESSSGVEVRYWLYLPEHYDANEQLPLILFLHGSEERGVTIDKAKEEGLPELVETRTDFPFIVVSPQLPSGYWTDLIDPMDELLTHLQERLPIASDRLYLTGISLGGFGAWEYALRYPDRFAAVAPIAGGYTFQSEEVPEDICKLSRLPIWAFHGEADTSVEPYQSQVLVDAIQACGGEVKFTLYPETDHKSSWIKAYDDPALYEWFLEHRK